ncbi:hypothetical protein J6590_063601 [Homalodisca vitripennis]|nr:hypothetical protein J6590_063601 [Homalodisca vitripennis]
MSYIQPYNFPLNERSLIQVVQDLRSPRGADPVRTGLRVALLSVHPTPTDDSYSLLVTRVRRIVTSRLLSSDKGVVLVFRDDSYSLLADPCRRIVQVDSSPPIRALCWFSETTATVC